MSQIYKSPKICIVGCGIMGLSSAYCLAKYYQGADITIYSKDVPPNTTSNAGYGIVFCRSYDSKMYSKKIGEWSSETSRYCSELLKNPDNASKMGINPVDGFLVMTKKEILEVEKDPDRESIVHSPSLRSSCTYFRECTPGEIQDKFLSKNAQFDILLDVPKADAQFNNLSFYIYGTFIIDTDLYLLWMQNEMKNMVERGQLRNFKVEQRHVDHLSDLCNKDFDLIVNCSGLGAGKLVGDPLVSAIRAQWFLIRAPEITNLYYAGRTCICPRPGRVSLGSVFQWDRYDTEIDPVVTKDNWDRAKSLFPEIQENQILGEYVRLRPGRRGGARLEFERMTGHGKSMPVIHNYGHAGTGIGQHWGCALNVLEISKAVLLNGKSKL
ncbi:D-aspartate oxidase-like isoform X1 [Styela clava]